MATTPPCRERKPWKTVNRSNILLPLVTFPRIRVEYLRIHHNVAKNKARKNHALHYSFFLKHTIYYQRTCSDGRRQGQHPSEEYTSFLDLIP